MTRKIMPILCMAVSMLMLIASYASAGVRESKHDFSWFQANPITQFNDNFYSTNSGMEITDVCVFCHTPHRASSDSGRLTNTFLWNRTNSTYNYKVYSSPTLSTAISIDPTPKGITLMCMSCHDGVTTIQNIINAPGGGTAYAGLSNRDQIGDVFPSFLGGEGANIGYNWGAPASGIVDLSNDHPVSFTWVPGLRGIKEPNTWPPNTVKLFKLDGVNDRMECATCHDPHDTTNPPFLRMSNANSAMCMTCHDK